MKKSCRGRIEQDRGRQAAESAETRVRFAGGAGRHVVDKYKRVSQRRRRQGRHPPFLLMSPCRPALQPQLLSKWQAEERTAFLMPTDRSHPDRVIKRSHGDHSTSEVVMLMGDSDCVQSVSQCWCGGRQKVVFLAEVNDWDSA